MSSLLSWVAVVFGVLALLVGFLGGDVVTVLESFWVESGSTVSYDGSANVTGNLSVGGLVIWDNGTHYILG